MFLTISNSIVLYIFWKHTTSIFVHIIALEKHVVFTAQTQEKAYVFILFDIHSCGRKNVI